MMLVVALLLAYLLGSVSGSLVLGRLRGVDIRQHGSGNAGGTNAFRTLGWRFALAVVLVDVGKGALAAWLGLALPADGWISPEARALACGLLAAIGHTWPLWHGFRGGKGAGTLVGALLVCWPLVVPVLLAVWLLVLGSSGYVGLATVVAGIALVPADLLLPGGYPARAVFAVVAALFLVFTHRSNLLRLRSGTEHRFDGARLLARRRD